MKVKSNKVEVVAYPYIINGDLVIDLNVGGDDIGVVSYPFEQLFAEYIEDRVMQYMDDTFDPEYKQETFELVALLRHIAKELEKQIDNVPKELH